jgi:pimeloyl-ACP methyl ester carboxylesterase
MGRELGGFPRLPAFLGQRPLAGTEARNGHVLPGCGQGERGDLPAQVTDRTSDGHDMDHYADDLAALTAHLDLQDAVHVGHSTGGGEVVQYIARHGQSRVAKAVLISAVPPLMVQTEANPDGLPKSVGPAGDCANG